MAAKQEFKTVSRTFKSGDYPPPDELLNSYGVDGWELRVICAVRGKYENEIVEVFYLQRQVTG